MLPLEWIQQQGSVASYGLSLFGGVRSRRWSQLTQHGALLWRWRWRWPSVY